MSGSPIMPAPASPKTDGQLLEVFSSIQGEGMLVGCRQIFVRMAQCNLNCAYCDTPFAPAEHCRIEDAPASGNFVNMPNPVSLDVLSSILFRWRQDLPGVHHSISLTGGEPLLQAEVLRHWLPSLRAILPLHLETNGTLPAALGALLAHLDYIAMDVKLASVTGVPIPWQAHQDFLETAKTVSCCVKAVVGEETPLDEVQKVAQLVGATAPDALLILQPQTYNGQVSVTAPNLLALQEQAARIHANTRVIPQVHHFLKLL
jgi:7-carboxy-7-deazaguanine synthase